MSLNHKRLASVAAATTAMVGIGVPAAHAAVQSHRVRPDINRVDCFTAGDALVVYQSDYSNSDCFENAGGMNVKIYNIDDVYTGNNGTRFTVNGYVCNDPYKDTMATSYCPGMPTGQGATMTTLSIYPGQD